MSNNKSTGQISDSKIVMGNDYNGQVVFNGETAGYQNAVGMYTYAADGTITGVQILWSNASLKGSDGNLIADKSAVNVALQAGDRVGFFIVPNGYAQDGMAKLLSDTSGSFKMVDAKGNPGNVNGGVELKLVHVDANGKEDVIKSEYGTSLFHSLDDGTKGLNGDKFDHALTTLDPVSGTVKISFEDIQGGGDKDFDDCVITLNIGVENAKLIANGKVEGTLKAAAEKAAAEKAAADKAAADKAAAEKAAADKAAADKAAADKAAADKAAADKAAADKAAADKAAADKAAADKAAADKAAADKAAADKAAADKAHADELAAEKATADASEAAKHAAGELLVDSSFEQAPVDHDTWSHFATVGGWKSDTEIEVWGKDFLGVTASDGNKHAELDYDNNLSNIYQDVQTEAGKAYTFSFDYAQRPGTSASTNTIEVLWNGQLIGTVDPTSTDWTKATFEVVGTGALDRIEFREDAGENDSLGGLIDNASLRAVPVVLPPDSLTLHATDVVKAVTSEILVGTNSGDKIVGGAGNDQLYGKDGDDVLVGDDNSRVTAPLDIAVSLVDADHSEQLSLTIGGMPKGATLSAGKDNGDGTWSLTLEDLSGLSITADDSTNFKLHVVATATDVSGAVMTESADISVAFDSGNQDLLVGGKGNDTLDGGAGNDIIYGGSIPTAGSTPHVATFADDDVIHGGAGNDVIYGNSGDDKLFGDDGDDFISGGKGNDLISGGDGDDILQGNSGDDMFTGDAGNDTITGGSGFDTLDYSMATNGMFVDMSNHVAIGMGNDTIDGIEKVIGSDFDDTLIGDSHDNVFVGGAGNDTITGGKGNDTLTGGDGNDTFTWTKSDVYNTKSQTSWVDHITDFQVGDKIELSGFFKPGTTNIASLVSVTDGADGSVLSVKFAGEFHAVAVLDNVHGLTASDMMKDGMLFVA